MKNLLFFMILSIVPLGSVCFDQPPAQRLG
jgi:hypothetical protein